MVSDGFMCILTVFPFCFPKAPWAPPFCTGAEDAGQPSSEAEVPPNEPAVPDTGR